jgi:hypothetical protein
MSSITRRNDAADKSALRVDGIELSGKPSTIKTVSGLSPSTGQELQGELMFGRSGSGKPMFLLKGKDKDYVLRGADGKLVTNALDAEARAIKLINGGGATQLRQTSEAPNSDRPPATPAPADRSTWSQKVDYAGYKAIVNNVFKPAGGLLKAVGLPQLDGHVKRATADLDQQAASLGMNTQDNLVKGTDLAVNAVFAYGGGAIGKAGKLVKLPQMAQTAIGFGVMPALQRAGSDASDGKLNRGTVKRAGIDIAQGVAIGKLGGKGMVRQIAAGTSLQVGRQALEGKTITPGGVMKTALLTTAGSAGLHAGAPRPKIQLASSARPAATVQQSKSAMAEMKNAVNAYDKLGATANHATRAAAAKRVVAAQQDVNSLRDLRRANGSWSAKDKQQYLSVMKAYGPRADQIGGAHQHGQGADTSGQTSTSMPTPTQTSSTPDASGVARPAQAAAAATLPDSQKPPRVPDQSQASIDSSTADAGAGAALTPEPVKMTRTQAQPGNPVTNPEIRASISPVRVVRAADGSLRLSKANGRPVSMAEVVRAVANGRITPKQLERAKFDDASIKGIVGDARALKGSTAPKQASASDQAYADVLKTLRNNPDVQKAMDHTRSTAEVAKTNRAVKDMEANNVFRGAHVEPESGGAKTPELDTSTWKLPMGEQFFGKQRLPTADFPSAGKQRLPAEGFPWRSAQPGLREPQQRPQTGSRFAPQPSGMTLLPQTPRVLQPFDQANFAGFNADKAFTDTFGQFTKPLSPMVSVSDGAGKLLQLVPDGLGTATKNLTSGLDSGIKAVEQSAPVQWLGSTPAVRVAGNGLNMLADGYRATGRLALNNPLIDSTVGRYQALSRQMRYFPEHAQAVRSLNQQKNTAKDAVRFYQDASRKLGTVNMEARSVAEQAQRQLARADEAAARGDKVTERHARQQASIGVKRLQELSGSAAQPLQDIADKAGAQIKKGEKLLAEQEQLYNLRAQQYQSALQADQQVQTPRVLEARQRLQEASLPFKLPEQVNAKTAAYEELATQPDNSPNHVKAVEKAHAALKGTTTELSKLTLAGNDPVLDTSLDGARGLREQLELLRREQSDMSTAIEQLHRQQQALAQRAGGNPSAALQDALTGLDAAHQLLGTRLASAQGKSARLADEPVFAGERARSNRLAVDAIAAESDLSAKVADAGFLHSSAKDIVDGKGKGRIDVLSNKGKIEAAQQRVDATRAEIVQWRQQLTDIKASAQTILGARGTDKPAQQQALASQQWLHDDAARKLGQATKRLATAERLLDLEQRAAEPRSIQVRVRDLQAKINTSAAVLRSAQTQHAEQQGNLQGKLDTLRERLQDTSGGAQREQLQAQVQKLDTRMQANDHALARVADIHSGTESLLPQAQEALGAARDTAGMTPGKLARNVLRGAMVASTLSKGLTISQLQLGMVAPDKPADLQPLLAQLNLPGSEKKIELESIRPVPGVRGLHSIDTVQGKVYAWRVRGAFSDVMVVAQPTPQARGMLMAALLNGGKAGNASPSIQKGSEGLYMTIDSQKFALMGATFSSVFHPDPNSTALNWWETVKIEVGSVGGTLRGNTKGTHPRTGAKQPMVELVQSNSIKAPLKFNNIKLPGTVPLIGNVLQVPDGVGLSVTVKNSLGVGRLSLVYDPELGVGQLADRTVSNELKFTGQLNDKLGFAGAHYPGNQPYGFFGTAIRIEKDYYAIEDPRNKGHWLMKATEGAETVFDRATGKPWLSKPLTEAIQSGLDAAKPVVNNGLKGLGQAGQEAEKRLRQVPPTLRQWLDDATKPPEPSQPSTPPQRKPLPDDKAR